MSNVVKFPEKEKLGYLIDGSYIYGCTVTDDVDMMIADFRGERVLVDISNEIAMDLPKDDFIHFCVMCLGLLGPDLLAEDESQSQG